jgi:hypothetical protein
MIRGDSGLSKLTPIFDPLRGDVNFVSGWNDYVARRRDQGIDRVEKTREMDANFWAAHWYLGVFYEQRKMYPYSMAEIYAGLGDKDQR